MVGHIFLAHLVASEPDLNATDCLSVVVMSTEFF